ncbi:porin family protein [Flavobacterium qiangtangense]|uniref:Porin family protein n=1 Tax=Flavobacterium qiangtangense TaxID=1442595 RepID=A0ABW1PQR1_9FLAO
MKKLIIATLFLCFGIAKTNAQVTVKPGVKAGLNLSSLTNSEADSRTDFYAGGFVDIKLASFYTLSPEIIYSRQGATVNNYFDELYFPNPDDPAFRSRSFDLELQYVSIGVMNKFRIVEGFHAMVGPSFDFKVGDNLDNDDLIDFDLAILGGLGYTFPIGLTVEARFKQGLADIFGDNYSYNYDYDDNYNDNLDHIKLNQVLQFGVSYAF